MKNQSRRSTITVDHLIEAIATSRKWFADLQSGEAASVLELAELKQQVREALASLVAKGGFPQMLLPPVNFNDMYMKQKQGSTTDQVSNQV